MGYWNSWELPTVLQPQHCYSCALKGCWPGANSSRAVMTSQHCLLDGSQHCRRQIKKSSKWLSGEPESVSAHPENGGFHEWIILQGRTRESICPFVLMERDIPMCQSQASSASCPCHQHSTALQCHSWWENGIRGHHYSLNRQRVQLQSRSLSMANVRLLKREMLSESHREEPLYWPSCCSFLNHLLALQNQGKSLCSSEIHLISGSASESPGSWIWKGLKQIFLAMVKAQNFSLMLFPEMGAPPFHVAPSFPCWLSHAVCSSRRAWWEGVCQWNYTWKTEESLRFFIFF